MRQLSGKCLCGAVQFKATGDVKRVSACYCSQCRAQNGGGPFYGAELKGALEISGEDALVWYASSDRARRAFCGTCGSSMFWISNDDPAYFDVSLGVLDDTSDLKLDAHIFVDMCPGYMSVPDNAPHWTEADVFDNPLKDS